MSNAQSQLRSLDLVRATASTRDDVQTMLLFQLASVIPLAKNMPEKRRDKILGAGLALLEELAPNDVQESILACQMVATHLTAMECLRRAKADKQTPHGRDDYLKQAAKFMALYAKQLETLDKHRGKGQQHVVVEHVSVTAGGQAFVGALSRGQAALPCAAGEPMSFATASSASPKSDVSADVNSVPCPLKIVPHEPE
jgi:hypothetical protein